MILNRVRLRKIVQLLGVDITEKPRAMMQDEVQLLPSIEVVAPYVNTIVAQPVFIQIGAFDGQSNDPLVNAAIKFNWKGILVEPQGEACSKLQSFHAHRPQFVIKQVAISHSNEDRVLYTIKKDPQTPGWMHQLASFDRRCILRHQHVAKGHDLNALIEEQIVRCMTFDQLFSENDIDHVDVLQIDAEGYDFELLRQFRVQERLPILINFEHKHLSKRDWNSAVDLLVQSGYKVAKSGFDTLALRLF